MDTEPLIVLSLDGGGVRSLSSLLILNEIIKRLIILRGESLQAHDIFKLVCGTSGGGLCAMMLARLCFDIPECVAHLCNVSNTVFAGGPSRRSQLSKGLIWNKYSTAKLENAIQNIRRTTDGLREASTCKCYIVCRETDSCGLMLTHNETCLASFPNRQPACTVWEAGRATSAAQTYFDPMKLEGRFFTDGGISYNNPIFTIEKQLPLASLNRQSNRQCYVSIGTGKASPANQETARSSWKLSHVFSPIENLLQAATQAEKDAEAFHSFCELLHDPMIGKHCYHFRFNCDNGLAEIELDEAEKLPIIIRQTQEYLQRASVQADINRCVTVINGWL